MSKAAYNDGYAHGYLSNEELAEIGHTPQSYAEHVESEYRQNVYDPKILSDQTEFFYGLLDGANDRAKKRG